MASATNIPEPVADFIRQHIHSVLQLELLLWLREQAGRWTPQQIAAELRITDQSAQFRLRDLALRGLVAEDTATSTFSYAPTTLELAKSVDALAACYATTRYSVINLIFSVPGDSARSLADAFRLRKKKSD